MNTAEIIDLYSLQVMLREGISEIIPNRVWVKAEIASVQVKSNGHCYMDLCQNIDGKTVAKVKATIWRNQYLPLISYFREATGGDLKSGMEVLFNVLVNYSEVYGLSLTVYDLDANFTLGAAELKRQQTIKKLESDGLLTRQQELTLAALPYRLAIISARDAAGYGDFCRQLDDNEAGFHFEHTLFEATMQGEYAPQSIVDAISLIESAGIATGTSCPRNDETISSNLGNTDSGFDAILIIRGGGSALDLACFDDYGLCFAIANCSLPVFTAIGHDRDYHIADMVAHEFVKTPTALAEIFIDCYTTEDQRVESYRNRLKMAFINRLRAMENAVELLQSRIHAADPRNILHRGYTLVTDSKGVVQKSAAKLQNGDEVRLLFSDGELIAQILSISKSLAKKS